MKKFKQLENFNLKNSNDRISVVFIGYQQDTFPASQRYITINLKGKRKKLFMVWFNTFHKSMRVFSFFVRIESSTALSLIVAIIHLY